MNHDSFLWLLSDSLRVFVALGETANGFTSEVEAFDFSLPGRSCSPSNFPYSGAGAFGLDTNTVPIFCGGHNDTDHTNECYIMNEQGSWSPFQGMQQKRYFLSWSFSSENSTYRTIVPRSKQKKTGPADMLASHTNRHKQKVNKYTLRLLVLLKNIN